MFKLGKRVTCVLGYPVGITGGTPTIKTVFRMSLSRHVKIVATQIRPRSLSSKCFPAHCALSTNDSPLYSLSYWQ